jgi:hypothetical protein
MEPLASGTYHMAWLSFEEPIRRRACLFFFKKKEAYMQRSQCKSGYRGKDVWVHPKGKNMIASVQTEVATQRERAQGLQGLPPKAVLGFEKLHDFVGGK